MPGPSGVRLVVVGVDGSPESVDAARYAADEAAVRGLELVVVHASTLGSTGSVRDSPASAATRRTVGQTLVDETLSHVPLAPTTVVRTIVEIAPAADLLTAVAGDAALLVLGQHHFDPADGRLAGPVAPAVAEHARCPVIVVPAGWSRTVASTAHLGPRPIVAGVGGLGAATAVLQLAYQEAELRRKSVLILHASRGPDLNADRRATTVRTVIEIVTALRQDHPDVATDYRFVPGATLLTWVDASARASLVVVGRPRHPHGRRSWQHSVARAMLHQTRCPLVVVPPSPQHAPRADRPAHGSSVLVP